MYFLDFILVERLKTETKSWPLTGLSSLSYRKRRVINYFSHTPSDNRFNEQQTGVITCY